MPPCSPKVPKKATARLPVGQRVIFLTAAAEGDLICLGDRSCNPTQ